MLLWLLCSLLLIPRPSISLSLVWRAEELHISELSLSALPTLSPFPFSLSFQRSLYLDIDLPQPFRLTDYPHLSYCNLSFSITHTTCGPPAGLPGCVHLCAGTSEVPFDTCFILSKSPCTPTTVSHVLITLISTFSSTCKLPSSFSVYLIEYSLQQTSKTRTKMLLGHYCLVSPISC